MAERLPNLLETTLGVFLHDIGKFLQRAHRSRRELSEKVQKRESDILPKDEKTGRYTHLHALWTDEFFEWMDNEKLAFPKGIDKSAVRNVAVYHHNPLQQLQGISHLAAEADRIASGMERKQKDEQEELAAEKTGWDAFIKTPLDNPFAGVDLGLRSNGSDCPWLRSKIPLGELVPGEQILPVPYEQLDLNSYPARYRQLWESFQAEFAQACRKLASSTGAFCDALYSLSERFLWAVPSSTKDQPDISLHDHHSAAAAIAAALYRWHENDGSLHDISKIGDRSIPKFRFLAGDLSGIQHSIFLLANQRVRGVNRILRARSFLLTMIAEAGLIACLRRLELPIFSQIQNAGGRFLLLVPDVPELEGKVEALRDEIDRWMLDRYLGELALNLALSEPFSAQDLMQGRLPGVLARLGAIVREAKFRAFRAVYHPVVLEDKFERGPCEACAVRPAVHVQTREEVQTRRCTPCQQEHDVGSLLPRTRYLAWTTRLIGKAEETVKFFDNLYLGLYEERPWIDETFLTLQRVFASTETRPGPEALRRLATYVPHVSPEEAEEWNRQHALADEQEQLETGAIKPFLLIAEKALEPVDGDQLGEPFLAVLKADVDRLGFIFSYGLKSMTLSRLVAVSRMMDLFFTGYLYELLRREFPETYTVYAGGDDLLLIGPWRQMLELASRIREKFGIWTGGNPNVTVSAGIELIKEHQPLTRAAGAAEEQLESAKDHGRDRIQLWGQPLTWNQFRRQLEAASKLTAYMREGLLSQGFVHRILSFDRDRRLAQGSAGNNGSARRSVVNLKAASWRARWTYHVARLAERLQRYRQPEAARLDELKKFLFDLLPSSPAERDWPGARTAAMIALYRNRKPEREYRR